MPLWDGGAAAAIPQLSGETPLEYSQRLIRAFPLLHRQFDLIVEAYHKDVYAASSINIEHFRAAQGRLEGPAQPTPLADAYKNCIFWGSFDALTHASAVPASTAGFFSTISDSFFDNPNFIGPLDALKMRIISAGLK